MCGGRDGRSTARWGAVECAHTHIRSDCLEELVASRNWLGVLLQRVLQRQRSGIGLDGLRTDFPTNKRILHVDTYYKYSVTMYFWVGSL